MDKPLHDPVPDGKTGPWLRERHNHKGFQLTYDERCELCRASEERFKRLFGRVEREDERDAERFRFEHRPEND